MSHVPKFNFSFIHIPKTGGSSLTRELSQRGLCLFNIGHTTLSEIHNGYSQEDFSPDLIKHPWDRNLILNSYKIATVRHPYDRIRSYYRFLKNMYGFDMSLEEFVLRPPPHIKLERAWWSQTSYLFLGDKMGMDRIIKFENMKQELRDLFKSVGYEFELKIHHHRTNSENIELTSTVKDYLYDKYEKDFKNFNYKK